MKQTLLTHLIQPRLQHPQHILLDKHRLVVEVLDDVVVLVVVDFQDYGFYGGVAGDEDS